MTPGRLIVAPPSGGHRVLLAEPGTGCEQLVEAVGPQRLTDQGGPLALPGQTHGDSAE
jgi:hypothetical protein